MTHPSHKKGLHRRQSSELPLEQVSHNEHIGEDLVILTLDGVCACTVLFVILLVSFWAVARYRRKPRIMTAEEQVYNESLGQWIRNTDPRRKDTKSTGVTIRKDSTSTETTYDTNVHSLSFNELNPPPRAHLDHPSANPTQPSHLPWRS